MKVLVTRGVTPGSLAGIGMEGLALEADLVIALPQPASMIEDSAGGAHEIRYLDLDPAEAALMRCMERIKTSWEQEFPDEAHLGHAAAGNWLFHWFSPRMETMADLLAAGRSNDLRAAADDFIDGRFGWAHGPTLKLDEQGAA